MDRNVTTAGIAENKGKYFIALRKKGKNLGSVWEFPGGKKDPDESPEQALIREYFEEFNLKIEIISQIFETEFKTAKKNYLLKVFSIKIEDNQIIKLSEHMDYRWEYLDKIRYLDMPDSDKKIIEYLIDNYNK